MTTGLLLRPVRVEDAEPMRRVARDAYAHYVPRIGREPAPMTADYDHVITRGQAWVAEHRGQLVGLLVLVPADDHLLLENIAVAPNRQGQRHRRSFSEESRRASPRPRPSRDTALHQRSNDREPDLLPTTRLPRDPSHDTGRIPPGLLRQDHIQHVTVTPDKDPRTGTEGLRRQRPDRGVLRRRSALADRDGGRRQESTGSA